MQQYQTILEKYLGKLNIPSIRWSDILEILIIAFLVYHIILWIKNTRAWALLKILVMVLIFVALATLLNMTTILWVVQNVSGIAVIAFVVILQPELRSALEELGQKNFFGSLQNLYSSRKRELRFSDRTVNEIVRACSDMAQVKTGVLIVIEQNTPLQEYEKTGIAIDAIVSSQLLINIFEKNTPLHDGAVIIRGDRVTSATCYLPLSNRKMDKDLGTRHRAGVGISEETDSLTIIVSEETGRISMAYKGILHRDISPEKLREHLVLLQDKDTSPDKRKTGKEQA